MKKTHISKLYIKIEGSETLHKKWKTIKTRLQEQKDCLYVEEKDTLQKEYSKMKSL